MPINPVLIHKAMMINIMLALLNMLPIPSLDGADIFFASRLLYAFSFGFLGGISAMLYYVASVKLAIFVGLFVGGIFWLVFAVKIDKEF